MLVTLTSGSWETVTGGAYKTPPETQDLEIVLDKLIPREIRNKVVESVHNRPDLWVVRAVMGVNLPMPMTFEMLSQYLVETGHGSHSPEELEKMFGEQIKCVL